MLEQEQRQPNVRKISCIVCPLSCVGDAKLVNGEINLTGFNCERGKAYAKSEIFEPKRMLTTTIGLKGGRVRLLPVISKEPLPKEQIFACVRCLASVEVDAPVKAGDVVYQNILGLGVDIIASRSIGI